MKKMTFLIVIVSLLSTACATGGNQPKRKGEASNKYSHARFLKATGSAGNPEDAKRRALANLAKIFEVKVEETSRDESSAWRKTNGSDIRQGASQETARHIDAYTTKLLEGANIAESWYDKKQSRHFALAVISRAQLSTRLRGDIVKADRYLQHRLTNAEQLQDPIAKAQMIYSARSELRSRELMQKDLQIIDRTGTGIPSPWTTKALDTRIDAAMSKAKVSASTPGDAQGELNGLLQEAIAAAGMRYAAQSADYQLQGELDVQDVGWRQGWYWHRGSLRVTLIKIATGQVSATAQWPLKSSAQSQKQSRIRLKDDVARLLNTAFKTELLSFTAKTKSLDTK